MSITLETSAGRRVGLSINIFNSNGENPVLEDLLKKSVEAPGLIPYILGQIAGHANQIAKDGVFSGSLPGFSSRTSGPTTKMGKPGDAKRIGLKATFRGTGKGSSVSLWSGFANLYENFTKRPQVHILQQAISDIQSAGVINRTIEHDMEQYANGQLTELDKYVRRGGKHKK